MLKNTEKHKLEIKVAQSTVVFRETIEGSRRSRGQEVTDQQCDLEMTGKHKRDIS